MSVHFSSPRSAADDAMRNRASLAVRRLAAALSLARVNWTRSYDDFVQVSAELLLKAEGSIRVDY